MVWRLNKDVTKIIKCNSQRRRRKPCPSSLAATCRHTSPPSPPFLSRLCEALWSSVFDYVMLIRKDHLKHPYTSNRLSSLLLCQPLLISAEKQKQRQNDAPEALFALSHTRYRTVHVIWVLLLSYHSSSCFIRSYRTVSYRIIFPYHTLRPTVPQEKPLCPCHCPPLPSLCPPLFTSICYMLLSPVTVAGHVAAPQANLKFPYETTETASARSRAELESDSSPRLCSLAETRLAGRLFYWLLVHCKTHTAEEKPCPRWFPCWLMPTPWFLRLPARPLPLSPSPSVAHSPQQTEF